MATTTASPTNFKLDVTKGFAWFDDYSLHVQLSDDALFVRNLYERAKVDIDDENIPVLIGVHWHGDHKASRQVHLPDCIVVDDGDGERHEHDYDRIAVIDAAIFALQHARKVVERSNGNS